MAAESKSSGRDLSCRTCGRRDARQEIGACGGVAAELGGPGSTPGSANSQPAPQPLRTLSLLV